jgi:hypothetical protein
LAMACGETWIVPIGVDSSIMEALFINSSFQVIQISLLDNRFGLWYTAHSKQSLKKGFS